MGKFYLGTKNNGVMCRFWRGLSEEEFVDTAIELGGALPKGFIVWEFNEGENIRTSKRVQAIADLPLVKDYLGMVDPVTALKKAKNEQREAEQIDVVKRVAFT
ncbi:hypothetical protein [Paenibacillus elgii]|uniref:hypothetical protein n=1 Tax=Paenibacillus elgii TaxID=189691 RepID=UPI0013D1063F|nr:hypothetical protein [Paenibacillus elgii]